MEKNKAYKILLRLRDGMLTEEQREQIVCWLGSGQDAEEKETALFRIWEEAKAEAGEASDASLQATWQKIASTEKQVSRRRLILPVFLRYAAVCLLICAASLGSWKLAEKKYSTSSEMIECFVPYGERRSVNLPDGSRIQLNSGTILVYPADFTGKSRTVYLSGEANLAIQKDDRPFILHTGNLIVEVLGTRFNVESYPGSGHITTTLEEGSVKLYKKGDPAGSIRLKPNEQLTYLSHEEAFHIRRNVNTPDYSAWTKGNLHFINEPLDEILFTLERKYDIRFLVDQRVSTTDLYTIKYKAHESISDVIHVLTEIMGDVKFQQEGRTIRLTLKRKEVRF